jgi:hypothetical protein
VDAYGGKDIMWMELEFVTDQLRFNSYTSRFGMNGAPKIHMAFEGTKMNTDISNTVATQLNYPKNEIAIDFADGLPFPDWGTDFPTITSASYIYRAQNESLINLAQLSGDPYTIKDMPYVSQLKVSLAQNEKTKDHTIILYLSKSPLVHDTDGSIILEDGFIKMDLFNGIFSFPEIVANQTNFTFTYLHPGEYYLTSKSHYIVIAPETVETLTVSDIIYEN